MLVKYLNNTIQTVSILPSVYMCRYVMVHVLDVYIKHCIVIDTEYELQTKDVVLYNISYSADSLYQILGTF